MRRPYAVTDRVISDLVESILIERCPGAAGLLAAFRNGPLIEKDREAAREILAEELVENGLGPDDEPNHRGHLIEAAIDWLGHR